MRTNLVEYFRYLYENPDDTEQEQINIEDIVKMHKGFLQFIRESKWDEYQQKLIPQQKEELAVIAEAAIDLCSITKKMQNEVASVGGPTDVAILSKSDGFIWKKRKHYFAKELNYHFEAKTVHAYEHDNDLSADRKPSEFEKSKCRL